MESTKEFQEETRRYFDRVAEDYDASYDGRFVRCMYREVVRRAVSLPGDRVLDLGCGNGNLIRMLREVKQASCWGADLSPQMIREAGKNLGDKVNFTVADAAALPYGDGQFDIVICNASFHHYTEPERAVEETEGACLYYDGELAQAYYHSSDGGATEDAENVWGTDVPFLRGKEDPYEAQISIPDYRWTVTYTWEELTWVLQNSGYDIGDVVDAYVSEVTDLGNVYSVTFVDSRGKTLVRTGDDARMAFYSTTLGKNVPSLRFTITGGTGGGSSYAVNSASGTLSALDGASVISGSGTVSRLEGEDHAAISASGTADLTGGSSGGRGSASRGGITITGTGNGHNVGMSQYGARAMAGQGHDYIDILEFYFTGIRVR